jgi:hypothetical protein
MNQNITPLGSLSLLSSSPIRSLLTPFIGLLIISIFAFITGCETPACKSNDDCREGLVCDLEFFVGECVEELRFVNCGTDRCYIPEICVNDRCVIADQAGTRVNADLGSAPSTGGEAMINTADRGGVEWTTDRRMLDMQSEPVGGAMMSGGTSGGSPPTQDSGVMGDQDTSQRLDQGGQECQSACDCSNGLACQAGSCVALDAPVYCCEGSFCPPDQTCESAEGQMELCPEQGCQTACDCTPGLSCLQGRCQLDAAPMYCCDQGSCPSGMGCQTQSGQQDQCPSIECMSACDCSGGERCSDGICTLGDEPIFCCDSSVCPSGQRCEDPFGRPSMCSGEVCLSACDCSAGLACLDGQCQLASAPVFCCETNPCPFEALCQPEGGGPLRECP